MTGPSEADKVKVEQASKILLADRLQMIGQRDAVVWMALQEAVGIYLIGLASGELRWLPRDAVDAPATPPEAPPQQPPPAPAPVPPTPTIPMDPVAQQVEQLFHGASGAGQPGA